MLVTGKISFTCNTDSICVAMELLSATATLSAVPNHQSTPVVLCCTITLTINWRAIDRPIVYGINLLCFGSWFRSISKWGEREITVPESPKARTRGMTEDNAIVHNHDKQWRRNNTTTTTAIMSPPRQKIVWRVSNKSCVSPFIQIRLVITRFIVSSWNAKNLTR